MEINKEFTIAMARAECLDCNWTTESAKNAQAIAAKHAKKHRHKVRVEVGMAGYYNGRDGAVIKQRGLFD